jgi:hypothetical protein
MMSIFSGTPVIVRPPPGKGRIINRVSLAEFGLMVATSNSFGKDCAWHNALITAALRNSRRVMNLDTILQSWRVDAKPAASVESKLL